MTVILYTFHKPVRLGELSGEALDMSLIFNKHKDEFIPPGQRRELLNGIDFPGRQATLRTKDKTINGREDTVAELVIKRRISANGRRVEGEGAVVAEFETETYGVDNVYGNVGTVHTEIPGSTDVLVHRIIRYVSADPSTRASGSRSDDDILEV